MPAYHLERSVQIDANPSQVRKAIEDFDEWPKWSPWLCMEPTAKISVYGSPGQVDHGYDWEGDLVGAGGMKIVSAEAKQLQMDLHFRRPFKSQAGVMLEIDSVGDNRTQVTWHMDGKLPFFLFFMVSNIKTMVGMDYERGLKMLKEYVETGGVKSRTEIVGIVEVPQSNYVGVEANCTMDDMSSSMGQTLPAAHKAATDHGLEMSGPPGALYHEFNMKQRECHYTAIVQTSSRTDIAGIRCGTIQPCQAVKVVHTGSYQHLGNAWSAAMSFQRYKKLKMLKSQCPFEIYCSDPCDTPEEEIITEVYVPVHG